MADAGGALDMPYEETLAGSEGLVLRLMGDSQSYTLLLRTGEHHQSYTLYPTPA